MPSELSTQTKMHSLAKPRSIPPEFKCYEYVEEGEVGSIRFRASLPNQSQHVTLSCRGRSVGYLVKGETPVKDDEIIESVDPFFFDSGYTSAGRTGFQIWAGSRLILEALGYPQPSDHPILVSLQRRVTKGAKVIELGSGVGLVGTFLAAMGAEVILTDLSTLVDNAIQSNIVLNEMKDEIHTKDNPKWMEDSNAVRIGYGWAGVKALDWSHPVHQQLPINMYNDIDFIIASDCVWLSSMLNSLLDTVASVFEASRKETGPVLLMSFQRRDTKQKGVDSMFTTVDTVVNTMKERNWKIECISWRYSDLRNDDGSPKEVYLFHVSSI